MRGVAVLFMGAGAVLASISIKPRELTAGEYLDAVKLAAEQRHVGENVVGQLPSDSRSRLRRHVIGQTEEVEQRAAFGVERMADDDMHPRRGFNCSGRR